MRNRRWPGSTAAPSTTFFSMTKPEAGAGTGTSSDATPRRASAWI